MTAMLLATFVPGAAACSAGSSAAVAPSPSGSAPLRQSATTSDRRPTRTGPGVTAVPVAEVVPLTRSMPVRVRIAAIAVDSALMKLGLRADGSLEVPPSGFPAGWYTGGPTPGELGPAVIAGHVDWHGPGVFYHLRNLKPGNHVIVTRADGTTPVFRVSKVAEYPKDQFPTQLVYGDTDHAALRLITCGGSFNSQSGHYEDNIVVFADLIAPGR